MKRFFILLFLCFSLTSYSQQVIENWSHPFQVLFVDSAIYIGKDEPVKQFDFISKYDLLDISGDIVLIHFTGRVTELKDIKLTVRELALIHHKEGDFQRPIISDPSDFVNKSSAQINFSVQSCIISYINLIYPPPDSNGIVHVDKGEDVFFAWELADDFAEAKTTLTIKNIFDEVLFQKQLDINSVSISLKNLEIEEDVFIVKIRALSKYGLEAWDEYGVYIENNPPKIERAKKYDDIIKALSEEWRQNKSVANVFYIKAINSANNNPRFINLYNDFLERNPEFKE